MLVIKIAGKKYLKEELEENSKIVRKWFAVKCMEKFTFADKYYCIENIEAVEKELVNYQFIQR